MDKVHASHVCGVEFRAPAHIKHEVDLVLALQSNVSEIEMGVGVGRLDP